MRPARPLHDNPAALHPPGFLLRCAGARNRAAGAAHHSL
ncbi:hypothetical protein L810_2539 [Burkholderia sp. AU4i]|nr:hypothetical protein L810_2539 [Burkholderia sp. AU4i]MDW9226400.1 hypothetical protein [Burkholderia cepacia]MDW9242063.1 hypothetical protein [Burkholderia cepacia]QOH34025.1 hypothetical protein C7S14_3649 [Burkholderia cepacia]